MVVVWIKGFGTAPSKAESQASRSCTRHVLRSCSGICLETPMHNVIVWIFAMISVLNSDFCLPARTKPQDCLTVQHPSLRGSGKSFLRSYSNVSIFGGVEPMYGQTLEPSLSSNAPLYLATRYMYTMCVFEAVCDPCDAFVQVWFVGPDSRAAKACHSDPNPYVPSHESTNVRYWPTLFSWCSIESCLQFGSFGRNEISCLQQVQ